MKMIHLMTTMRRRRSRRKRETWMRSQLGAVNSASGTSVKGTDAYLSSHSTMSICRDLLAGHCLLCLGTCLCVSLDYL
jgi:hypothetical protein